MMSRNVTAAVVAILLAAPAAQASPTGLASIPVSLTVQETCVIQSVDAAITVANQPAVACLHGAPFQVSQAAFDPTASGETGRNQAQPVEFITAHDAQQTVWIVNF
ncbi:hypothetical protein [Paraburkholderia sp.]|uniref:hypothetical protein n=1 Tax=Paraburkholderia sp. TaxID=1926495 RepID=UPI002D3FCF8B|nr:hypothetical protein [Paraburkholderia sp.]HZZ03746.1 hypothetical protein [Paraburkholderia sp.]